MIYNFIVLVCVYYIKLTFMVMLFHFDYLC